MNSMNKSLSAGETVAELTHQLLGQLWLMGLLTDIEHANLAARIRCTTEVK